MSYLFSVYCSQPVTSDLALFLRFEFVNKPHFHPGFCDHDHTHAS